MFHRMALRVVLATDKSLAENIREALLPELLKLIPQAFQSELWDTNPEGKGFRPGYVSFGFRPLQWEEKGLLGGILISGSYSSKELRSEAPEPKTPEYEAWLEAGGNAALADEPSVIMELQAGYYNKKSGGGVSNPKDLGEAIFTIGPDEEVESLVLSDDGAVRSGLEEIIQEIIEDPPELAVSQNKRKKRQRSPYRTLPAFLNYLAEEGRTEFRNDEVKEIAKYTKKRPYQIVDYLNKRGLHGPVHRAASGPYHSLDYEYLLHLLE